jgi:hypothetical protein
VVLLGLLVRLRLTGGSSSASSPSTVTAAVRPRAREKKERVRAGPACQRPGEHGRAQAGRPGFAGPSREAGRARASEWESTGRTRALQLGRERGREGKQPAMEFCFSFFKNVK